MTQLLSLSSARKMYMAVSGMLLSIFVILHLVGLLSLLSGPEAFNSYSAFWHDFCHGWARSLLELALLAVVSSHIYLALRTRLEARRARKQRYAVERSAVASPVHRILSRCTLCTGLFMGFFVIVHVASLRFGVGLSGNPDRYQQVLEVFAEPTTVLFYVAACICLGAHLGHGLWGIWQSLGVTSLACSRWSRPLALLLSVLLAVALGSLPLYLHFCQPWVGGQN